MFNISRWSLESINLMPFDISIRIKVHLPHASTFAIRCAKRFRYLVNELYS